MFCMQPARRCALVLGCLRADCIKTTQRGGKFAACLLGWGCLQLQVSCGSCSGAQSEEQDGERALQRRLHLLPTHGNADFLAAASVKRN